MRDGSSQYCNNETSKAGLISSVVRRECKALKIFTCISSWAHSFSDMIAIPDFAAGAMENWGLITYRETAMLYQPGVSSEGNKQRVAVVVSHELAHQVIVHAIYKYFFQKQN